MRFVRDTRPQKNMCFILMPYGDKELRDGRTINWDEHYKDILEPLPFGGVEEVEAKVLSISETFVTVQADDGRRGFLNIEDMSWTRPPRDLRRLFPEGRRLRGAFVVDLEGQQKYSLIAAEKNPWPDLEKEFPVGTSFRGIVARRPPGIGAFVPLKYGVDGLVPENQLPRNVSQGSVVRVEVARIEPGRRQVQLRFVEVLQSESGPGDWGPFYRGQTFQGRFVKIQPDRGYTLVEIQQGVAGLLHSTRMSPVLRERFYGGELRVGDSVAVEVLTVDGLERKLSFRDRAGVGLPPSAEQGGPPQALAEPNSQPEPVATDAEVPLEVS